MNEEENLESSFEESKNNNQEEDHEVNRILGNNSKMKVKLLYSFGNSTRYTIIIVQTLYLSFYLLSVLKISPFWVGTVLLIKQVFDAIMDPFCGRLSDIFVTRWGRRRPWIIVSLLPTSVLWLLMWFDVNLITTSQGFIIIYIIIIMLLFSLGKTAISVPYTALIADIVTTKESSTTVVMMQQIFGIGTTLVVGVIFSLVITLVSNTSYAFIIGSIITLPLVSFPMLLAVYYVKELPIKEKQDNHNNTTDNTIQLKIRKNKKFYPKYLHSIHHKEDHNYVKTKKEIIKDEENSDEFDTDGLSEEIIITKEKKKYFEVIKSFITGIITLFYKEFIIFVMFFLFVNICTFLFLTNVVLYVEYVLDKSNYTSILVFFLQLISVLSFFLWRKVSIILQSKKQTFYLGSIFWVIGLLGGAFIYKDENMVLVFILIIFYGFGCSVGLLIPLSLIPDLIRFDTKYKTKDNVSRAGIIYSMLFLLEKVAVGITLSFCGYMLSFVGFDEANGTHQNQNSIYVLKSFVSILPLIFLSASCVALFFLKIKS
eukprot:TRINITY_DN16551_c0_g1_i1.p1 TRINITY_DN16551_c0_g1~~TRINITY_DN16551_c0_g1_i1.p1  ORF type:complete len:540 (+),score=62.35 TRINITY_DN16551_c0_g1_i1:121-1740(+)